MNLRLLIIFCSLLFNENVIGQTIISNNEKYGIIDDETKKIIFPFEYDTIFAGFNGNFFAEKFSHSFILRKNNRYSFALKKHWLTMIRHESKDGWQTYPYIENGDSTKWELLNLEFESLYWPKGLIGVHSRKDATIQDYEIYLGDTCFQIIKFINTITYKEGGKYGLLTFNRTQRKFGSYVNSQSRFTRMIFSLDDIQKHPAKYDGIMNLRIGNSFDEDFFVTLDGGKYGLISLGKKIEIEPQFDAAPVRSLLTSNYTIADEQTYYYVKKNGLWGVVYLTKKNVDNYIVVIPFRYKEVNAIKNSLRSVNFYNLHFYNEEDSKRKEYDREYIASVYNSSPDTLPMQLNFIIRDGETNLPTKRNSANNKEELNKNYIPPTEKYITFTPKINNKSVVQQKEYEYLFTSNIQNIVYSKKLTTPMFFVVKMDRTEDVVNLDYTPYERGKVKKNLIIPSSSFSDNNNYMNRKPRAISIYRLSDDKFIPLAEFTDTKDSVTYEIVTDLKEYTTYYPVKQEHTYSSDFILKSTKLENGKYKHTFFTFEGIQVYEIRSKYPIDYWEFVKLHPSNHTGLSDEDFALEFYIEIPGEKKVKKKTVCYYNVKTKQFYK